MSSAIPPFPEDVGPRIRDAVRYCTDNSSFYRDRLREAGAEPDDIDSLEALEQLPVMMQKADETALQEYSSEHLGHPYGEHLCAPLEKVVSVNSTSGTTGAPTYYASTASDVAITDALWKGALELVGLRPGDAVVHGFGLSMYLAGIPRVRAMERMGLRTIPVGAEAGSDKLLRALRDHRPRALCCTPSYGQYLAEKADLTELGIEFVICGGEPGAGLPEVREHLREGFGGAEVVDAMGGHHGVMHVSCPAHDGMHVLGGEHTIQQLADPETLAPVAIVDGATGVRLKTTLDWEARPQLRSSVGDLYEVLTSPCACGRPGARAKVVGRIDDLLIVKGVKIYPSVVQDLVHEFRPQLTGAFQIVLPAAGPRVEPPLRMRIETTDGGEDAIEELCRRMHARYSITPKVERVAPASLPRSSHKAKLIVVEN